MIRTQIYLTETEQKALRAIARLKGAAQSEIIREAIDRFIGGYQKSDRAEMLRAACGIWADREDLDSRAIRSELDRSFGDAE